MKACCYRPSCIDSVSSGSVPVQREISLLVHELRFTFAVDEMKADSRPQSEDAVLGR